MCFLVRMIVGFKNRKQILKPLRKRVFVPDLKETSRRSRRSLMQPCSCNAISPRRRGNAGRVWAALTPHGPPRRHRTVLEEFQVVSADVRPSGYYRNHDTAVSAARRKRHGHVWSGRQHPNICLILKTKLTVYSRRRVSSEKSRLRDPQTDRFQQRQNRHCEKSYTTQTNVCNYVNQEETLTSERTKKRFLTGVFVAVLRLSLQLSWRASRVCWKTSFSH